MDLLDLTESQLLGLNEVGLLTLVEGQVEAEWEQSKYVRSAIGAEADSFPAGLPEAIF